MTRRLFAGVALSDAARTACADAAEQLRATGFAAKYEDAGKLHLTLAFLGNVEPLRYDEIVAAMRAAAASCAPFEVPLDTLGAFPHERKPRIVYIGAREQGAPYRALARAVRVAYAELGFAFEVDPVAHVTIARVKKPRRPLPLIEFPAIRLSVERITLFESLFDKEQNTSRYEVRSTVVLDPAGPALVWPEGSPDERSFT